MPFDLHCVDFVALTSLSFLTSFDRFDLIDVIFTFFSLLFTFFAYLFESRSVCRKEKLQNVGSCQYLHAFCNTITVIFVDFWYVLCLELPNTLCNRVGSLVVRLFLKYVLGGLLGKERNRREARAL